MDNSIDEAVEALLFSDINKFEFVEQHRRGFSFVNKEDEIKVYFEVEELYEYPHSSIDFNKIIVSTIYGTFDIISPTIVSHLRAKTNIPPSINKTSKYLFNDIKYDIKSKFIENSINKNNREE